MSLIETHNRSDAVKEASQRLEIDHLRDPDERQIAVSCARLGAEMTRRIKKDSGALAFALSSLVDARDSFIHALQEARK